MSEDTCQDCGGTNPAWSAATRQPSTIRERFFAHVEKTETCWLWTAALDRGYGRQSIDGEVHYAHRVSYELHVGHIPPGRAIDHICRVRSCVNPAHLRVVTTKQNSENRGATTASTSGARGVYWESATGKWRVQVMSNGVGHSAGRFSDRAEAEAAAIDLRNRLFTHNDPDRVPHEGASR